MTAEAQARRASLQRRLVSLEEEIARLRQELTALGGELRLPGVYLTVEVGETAALLPLDAVLEIVRLVAIEPLPVAVPSVLGTMIYRGIPALVVDLAALIGIHREPELNAHLVVCGGARTVALLVDRVRDLVEAPLLVDGSLHGEEATSWDASGLMAGLCRTQDGIRPLLRTSVLLAPAEGT